jgi:hypothetical protein
MTALHLHATARYYALPGLSPTRPNYHQGEGVLHDRRGDRKTVEVVYWPGADGFKRGATFYSRETRPGCKGGVPAEGGAAAEWLDEGAVIAYRSRTGPHRYRITGGVFREVRPRPRWGRMGRGRRQTVTSDWLYWTLLGYAGRAGR